MILIRLLYGTGNKAKIEAMRGFLRGLKSELQIIGPEEAGVTLPDVPEDGVTPLENAKTKAMAIYNMFHIPVFSSDTGLYFENLPESLQPGVHARRVNGKRLNDNEMTDYYASLAARFGGRIIAKYINAICLVTDNSVYDHMGDDISSRPFIICDRPHPKRVEGFPLDCISLHTDTGEYYYDDIKPDRELIGWEIDNGFYRFFKNALGL